MKDRINQCGQWLLERFPISDLWNDHMARYYAPKNFNVWYFFGSLALFVLVLQFVTGIRQLQQEVEVIDGSFHEQAS